MILPFKRRNRRVAKFPASVVAWRGSDIDYVDCVRETDAFRDAGDLVTKGYADCAVIVLADGETMTIAVNGISRDGESW